MKKLAVALCLPLLTLAATAADLNTADPLFEVAYGRADSGHDGSVNLAEALKFGVSRVSFAAVEPDADGTLDRVKFADVIERQFKAADPDKTGTLNWKEARRAGIRYKRIFNASNPTKDGSLNLDQYLAALNAQARYRQPPK